MSYQPSQVSRLYSNVQNQYPLVASAELSSEGYITHDLCWDCQIILPLIEFIVWEWLI